MERRHVPIAIAALAAAIVLTAVTVSAYACFLGAPCAP